jgi:hypothetical protein
MAGYVVAARIERAVVRPMPWADLWVDRSDPPVDEVVVRSEPGTARAAEPDLAERWGRVRDACGQLTWYLLDPQGWR